MQYNFLVLGGHCMLKEQFFDVKLSEKLIGAHGLVKFGLKIVLIVYNLNQSVNTYF